MTKPLNPNNGNHIICDSKTDWLKQFNQAEEHAKSKEHDGYLILKEEDFREKERRDGR